ncbi:MAG: hypothetical protein WCI71_01520 [Bacteroidota bacterium]
MAGNSYSEIKESLLVEAKILNSRGKNERQEVMAPWTKFTKDLYGSKDFKKYMHDK